MRPPPLFFFFLFFAPAHLLKLLLRLVICTCAHTTGFLSYSCIASPVLLFILGCGLRRGQVIAAEPCTQVPLRGDVILVWISLKEVVLRRISGKAAHCQVSLYDPGYGPSLLVVLTP